MKVIVEQKPTFDIDFDDMNWGVDATFYTDEEANATSCIYMFARVMELEGYAQTSIIEAMETWLSEHKEEVNEDRKLESV